MSRSNFFRLALILAALLGASASAAQETSVRLADLDWLVGGWTGEAFGGPCDEYYSPPAGGQIMGMFRLGNAQQVRVVEFISIVETEGKLIYRFRHFSPALKSWEGEEEHPLEFEVSRQGDDEYVLTGAPGQSITKMTITRQGDDQYKTVVHIVRDEQPSSFEITMKRKAAR